MRQLVWLIREMWRQLPGDRVSFDLCYSLILKREQVMRQSQMVCGDFSLPKGGDSGNPVCCWAVILMGFSLSLASANSWGTIIISLPLCSPVLLIWLTKEFPLQECLSCCCTSKKQGKWVWLIFGKFGGVETDKQIKVWKKKLAGRNVFLHTHKKADARHLCPAPEEHTVFPQLFMQAYLETLGRNRTFQMCHSWNVSLPLGNE